MAESDVQLTLDNNCSTQFQKVGSSGTWPTTISNV